ncbi:MAG: ABC transporter substrate-binding protein [Actinomycetota bacterium]|nr:ABC transporter substrate-binding protein [Actinomycetota bacterium]
MSTIAGSPRSPFRRSLRFGGLLLAASLVMVACGDDEAVPATTAVPATDASGSTVPAPLAGTVRLGFFPNVTHAPALVGVAEGTFAAALGDGVSLQTSTFNAGTEAVEALLAESLDITFIGPNPAINAHARSGGEAIRIISGSTSGGAYLVVKPELTSVEQLAGTTLATPSLGNTQDVALRAWLKENGLETTPDGGGDVSILPQSNSTTLESFLAGDIDGAWVPEPWATRLVEEGGGTVLVDERDLWPATGGEYVTTHVIVRTDFLTAHPDLVKAVLVGLADALALIEADPAKAQADVIAQITDITGSEPSAEVIAASFDHLTFTLDPIAPSLQKSADDAVAVGLLEPVELAGIYDLSLLNEILAERGEPEVEGL